MTPWWLHDSGLIGWIELLGALFIGHALCDFSLQTDFVSRAKNRHLPHVDPDLPKRSLWLYCLTAHASIHAGVVWVITGVAWFALAELFLHWLIDWLKIERKIGFHSDQLLHLLCKVLYVLVLAAVPPP